MAICQEFWNTEERLKTHTGGFLNRVPEVRLISGPPDITQLKLVFYFNFYGQLVMIKFRIGRFFLANHQWFSLVFPG
jgi:hypothetical protein